MPSINLESNPQPEEVKPDGEKPEEKPPTLTDHLNKKLLNSFLTRINSGDSSINQIFNLANNPDNTKNEEDFA